MPVPFPALIRDWRDLGDEAAARELVAARRPELHWEGADRSKHTFTLFMVQTQNDEAPTYPAIIAVLNEAN
jgi:hypothetical protein